MNVDPEDLLARIAEGEGRTLEFKRGLPRDAKTARSLCALANTRGGLLLIGVCDDGALEGCPRPREVMGRLREVAEHCIEPPLALQLGRVELARVRIVCCSVALSATRPHRVSHPDAPSEIVVRVGASNRAAGGATLRALTDHKPRSKSPDADGKRALEWLRRQSHAPEGGATWGEFATACNIGKQRARRTFVDLERGGWLVAHGAGSRRQYRLT